MVYDLSTDLGDFAYFPNNPTYGGWSQQMDYCPIVYKYSDNAVTGYASTCMGPQPAASILRGGETFGDLGTMYILLTFALVPEYRSGYN